MATMWSSPINESLAFVLSVICSAFLLSPAAAGPLQPAVHVRAPDGIEPHQVAGAVRRELARATNGTGGFNVKKTTTINRSWNGQTLLQIGDSQSFTPSNRSSLSVSESIKIVCTKCYITGSATAQLSIGHINVPTIISETFHQVEHNFDELVNQVENWIEDYSIDIVENIVDDGFHLSDFDPPTFNYSFNMDVPALPEANMRFVIDGLDLYIQLDTILSLSSTYTLNLYTSDTPIGIRISDSLTLGVVFTADLILDAAGTIDISSGFHIKVEDGLGIDIKLFADDVGNIIFNGGQFEFLPVTVVSAGFTFKAILRLGLHSGFDLNSPSLDDTPVEVKVFDIPLEPSMGVGVGIDMSVFANVAEFVTDVKYRPKNSTCELDLVQAYTFGLGAAAGATLSLGTDVWGPTPHTVMPIWYTTMGSACAIKGTPTPTSASPGYSITAHAQRRDALTTTTITTDVTYTGIQCKVTGMANCPASLQSTVKSTATTTIVTALPSGSGFTLASYESAVPTTVPFGNKAVTMFKSSGKPKQYTPTITMTATTTATVTATANSLKPLANDISHHEKALEIGLGVGLGVAVLLAVAAVAFSILNRRKVYLPVTMQEPPAVFWREDTSYGSSPDLGAALPTKLLKPAVAVTEMRRGSNGQRYFDNLSYGSLDAVAQGRDTMSVAETQRYGDGGITSEREQYSDGLRIINGGTEQS